MTLRAGLVDACQDERLFDVELWPRQREILASIEAGPRLQLIACGRRSGKTFMGALVALHDACLSPERARFVRKGERRYAVCVAVNIAQARLFVSFARSVADASPLLRPLIVDATDDRIDFSTGATIAAFPCTARGGRGWPISTLILDEFAHHVDTDGNSSAEAVWRSMTPSTLQFGDAARIVVASTPFGSEGKFAALFRQVEDGEVDGVAHQFASHEMNPRLDPSVLAREFEADPAAYETEILARFVAGGGAYLDPRAILAAVEPRGELVPLDGYGWVVGCDLGGERDPTGVVVVGRDPRRPHRLRVGFAEAWAARRSNTFEERREREDERIDALVAIAGRYGARVVLDQHLAPQMRDALARAGVAATVTPLTPESKSLAFAELRARLVNGTLGLYANEDLLRELRGLRTRLSAGKATVVTPRTSRGHSDLAVALALAVYASPGSGDGGIAYGVSRPRELPADSLELLELDARGRVGLVDLASGGW